MPKPRPRVTQFGTYTPSAYKKWEKKVADMAIKAWGERGTLEEPLSVQIEFSIKVPESLSKSERVKRLASGGHTQKPDLDNLAKGVMDALNHSGIWVDDSQVASLSTKKKWGVESYFILRINRL